MRTRRKGSTGPQTPVLGSTVGSTVGSTLMPLRVHTELVVLQEVLQRYPSPAPEAGFGERTAPPTSVRIRAPRGSVDPCGPCRVHNDGPPSVGLPEGLVGLRRH